MASGGVLIQLHWQHRLEHWRTKFVAQGEFCSGCGDDVQKWVREVISRRSGECPEDWCPMVCTQDSEYFVWANP